MPINYSAFSLYSNWTSSSDLFTPPSAWLVDKPRSWDEFCQQITENLVLKDGRTPKAMEDRLMLRLKTLDAKGKDGLNIAQDHATNATGIVWT